MTELKSKDHSDEKELGALIPELVALLGGMISTVIIVMPLSIIVGALFAPLPAILQVLVAPLVEEPSKAIGVILLALLYPTSLRTKRRGVILGALAGLGFAFTENLLYTFRFEMASTIAGMSAAPNILARAILPAPMHALASATFAIGLVFLAQTKFDRRSFNISTVLEGIKSAEVSAFIAIAIGFHFQYNFLAGFAGLIGAGIGLAIIIFLFYKIYYYLPDLLTNVAISGPMQLLSDAVHAEKGKPFGKMAGGEIPHTGIKFCIKCGAEVKQGASFCPKCGNRVKI
jgi:RsiW-degrading membrane proteinase PrsW (M82 family)